MTRRLKTVNTENLKRLCWSRGYHGVRGLAEALGRNRVTLYAALRDPKQYGPTYKKIMEALCE